MAALSKIQLCHLVKTESNCLSLKVYNESLKKTCNSSRVKLSGENSKWPLNIKAYLYSSPFTPSF